MKKEFLSFVLIGCLNTLLSCMIYWGMLFYFTPQTSFITAFIITTVFSYIMNSRKTFNVALERRKLMKYFLFYIFSYLAGRSILDLTITHFFIPEFFAILIVSLCFLPLNFLGNKYVLRPGTV